MNYIPPLYEVRAFVNLPGLVYLIDSWGFPGGTSGIEPSCQCRRCRFNPWVGKIPQRRAWQPTLVFLAEESHRPGSLISYRP